MSMFDGGLRGGALTIGTSGARRDKLSPRIDKPEKPIGTSESISMRCAEGLLARSASSSSKRRSLR